MTQITMQSLIEVARAERKRRALDEAVRRVFPAAARLRNLPDWQLRQVVGGVCIDSNCLEKIRAEFARIMAEQERA